ncbi:CDP-diacylglycerol--serine O-phosphatidyltransferase [Halobacteriales archaeon QH_10_70_21]|jgi:CDP-diacylglycerol--serine O-phosphatidyltransferase|nr:MAG: CDP-diacylglycerol--serine O-phosphatidyltransferase [Halobacteriales archaeon QH_10_70_21]
MQPRFLGQLGLADAVTVANAAVGFVAAAVAVGDPTLAARLVLLAAIADGLDGVIARARGGTSVGDFLDSLADVASFGVAPAVLVYGVAREALGGSLPETAALFGIPALFVVMAVVRLGFYMLEDRDAAATEGVQTTLAATILAVAYLSGLTDPLALLGVAAVFTYLMVAPITYPELYARDALVLGGLQALAVLFPTVVDRVFPRSLLLFAVGYLVLAPFVYWREA